VVELFNKYTSRPVEGDNDKYISVLDEQDRIDIQMCQAINESIDACNKQIRNSAAAGSTFCSLYLIPINDETNDMRAYCANVGDSRCVMVNAEEASDRMIMHKSSLMTTTNKWTTDVYSQSLHGFSSDSEDSISFAFSSHSATSPRTKGNDTSVGRKLFPGQDVVVPLSPRDAAAERKGAADPIDLLMKGRPKSVLVQQLAFSEDHSMQCTRELRRISGQVNTVRTTRAILTVHTVPYIECLVHSSAKYGCDLPTVDTPAASGLTDSSGLGQHRPHG